MSRIVIVGGHGKVALLTAPLLVEAGHEVLSLIRNPDHAEEVSATGALPVVLSVEEASTEQLTQAFAGARAVVWSAGAGGKGGPARTDAVDRAAALRSMDAAAAAGATRYVMVSFITAYGEVPEDHPLRAYAVAKIAADRHLQSTDLEWTILGPGGLTAQEPSGRITVERVGGDDQSGASALTSRGNVARVIAAVLDEPRSVGRVIPFHDGDTPIAQAVADVPLAYADLS
ncbi:NAD-dependent epimerase/dehydratase family protein [Actinomyces sp. 2119]|uniref:NAD-dependent epimerase/dehydratase family protein n=1 Tax=Actinomyces lilanjuaniae TaxID=2321394 RepID=A0ABM6Z5U2_9ACTO|nr:MULTISPECIES: NAD(P)H-binding protein [Actinomyces]AYD90579.1 NAD-dependent epimerase/dehydratase family protein [Actinomyces lilanjuaniae]RJF43968.1 NAD-dependent epimerase/dehydratase family protein [Actinomyces sp. 2119]